MPSISPQDEYDQIPDDFDYAEIGDEQWGALQTQTLLPVSSQDPDPSRIPSIPPDTNNQQGSSVITENGRGQALEAQEENSPWIPDSQSAVQPGDPHTPSSAYFSEDDLEFNEAFLTQLDAVENQLLISGNPMPGGGSTSSRVYMPFDKPSDCGYSTSPQGGCKRRRASDAADDLDESVSPEKRSKTGHSGNITEILEGYEDEISCPICCDLLVGAQSVNPCGHTVCGDCGYTWIVKDKHASCPVCRTKCHMSNPMVPNIIADNFVERHINVLALLGDSAWKKGGSKRREWNTRKEKWLEECAFRGWAPRVRCEATI